LTTLPLSSADCLEIWEPQPPGTLRACPGLSWVYFTFYHRVNKKKNLHFFSKSYSYDLKI